VRLGVDKQTISDWETGRYRMTAEALLALTLLYRADILELLATKVTKGAGAGVAGRPERTRRLG
jgi:transcriptional regulator with XRE-family HTH domain